MLLGLYKTAMNLSTPLLLSYLQKRTKRGKEDATRAHERRGNPTLPRPPAPFVWFHAASVGESLALLAVIDKMLNDYPAVSVMVTTGTVTSAKLMADRLPRRAFHQYVPVDHPQWTEKFLDHWHPDLVVWSESELWPNILFGIKSRRMPAVLLNARMSEETFCKWRFAKGMIAEMLSTFDLCLAQNEAEAQRLVKLGAKAVTVSTNLKYAAAPLPFDTEKLAAMEKETAGRDVVLFASTHAGEEEIALRVHAKLKEKHPRLLTIIVPRHPKRGEEITKLASGFAVSLRSKNEAVEKCDVYIADTLGELGLFYRLCKTVIMGGTFADVGGHNPIEPAQFGCVIFAGPQTYNFITITEDFQKQNALVCVKDENDLAEKLQAALENPQGFAAMGKAAAVWANEKSHVVDDVAASLTPFMAQVNKKERAAS